MLILRDAYHALDLPRGGIGTIGNYDGLHRGQRAIIERIRERARETGLASMVVTFEPHPVSVLRPQEAPPRLTTPEEKCRLLEAAGVDVLLQVEFDEELAATSAEEFVRSFLVERLGWKEVHVGSRFSFGRGREGNLELLQRLGEELGFEAFAVDEVRAGGERISSTRIRQAITEGRVDEAADLLGRPYAVPGTVVQGDRMGKRLGWPTVNLASPPELLLPGNGVYVSRVRLPELPATFNSVTNVGTRPTVYENFQRVVESHILDFATDVYGEPIEVHFLKRLREERMFPSVMDLSAQIRRDVEATKEYFASRRSFQEQLEEQTESESLAEPIPPLS